MKKSKTSQRLVILGIGFGCAILVIITSLLFSGLFTDWENKTLDYRFKLRGNIPTHPDIVMIDIDDASMKAIGRWPWDRSYHGKMIDILAKSGVSAIGYDVLFDQPSDGGGDAVLANAAMNAKNLYFPVGFALNSESVDPVYVDGRESSLEKLRKFVFPQKLSPQEKILNVERAVIPFQELLAVSNGAGHISSNRDPDGTIRRVPLIVNLSGNPFPAFGLSSTAGYLQVLPKDILFQPGSFLLIKGARSLADASGRDIYIPVDNGGMMIINYAGRWEDTFIHYSFKDIIMAAESETGRSDLKDILKGKICLVSNTATGYDLKPVPVEENFPGGGIHANIINTILTENFMRGISPAGKVLIITVLTVGAAWLSMGGLSGLPILIVAYWILSYVTFIKYGLITEMFLPSSGMVLGFLTSTLYGRKLERRHLTVLSGEKEQLGRELKAMCGELTQKEFELSNLRQEFTQSISNLNTVIVRDEGAIKKMTLLEERVESVLKEKDILLRSRQELEMKLARILSEPLQSEYHLQGEWEELQMECAHYGIITRSMKVLKIFEQVKRAAQTKSPVLVLGESGTGKELFARAIHGLSPRSLRHFVVVDTPAISDTLFESDLFGHVRGGFTGAISDRKGYFEMAQGGTIFLDEIGDLSSRIQAGLLGVLQRYEIKRVGSSTPVKVDVRVIAATNRNLTEDISKGVFREDLYYRLNVVTVELPPLRERMEDIEPLIQYFLEKYRAENGISDSEIKGLNPDAFRRLKAHSWKGNIRELENAMARAVTMAQGKWITDADIGPLQKGPAIPAGDFKSGKRSVITSSIPSSQSGNVGGDKTAIPSPQWREEGLGKEGFDADHAFLSLLERNAFSIDKTAQMLKESRGTVAHRLKGICFEYIAACNGDTDRASIELSGGGSGSQRKVRQRMEEYYSNLMSIINQYQNPEEAMAECRRRFKNLKGKYFAAVEALVKKHFEKNRQI